MGLIFLQSVSSIDAAVGEQAFAGGDEDAGGERVNRCTDLVCRREGWGDTDVTVARITAVGKGAARGHDLDAGRLGQRHDALGAAIEHVQTDELAAARVGPRRDSSAAESGLEYFPH